MPTLKDLTCSIELSDSQQTLQEFGTIYTDGIVETFVPVPSRSQSFSVHLTSSKFIAPGLAMYVFIDGVYQCNRNRQDLKLRKPSDSRSLVDFRVRQKEEKQKDGSMVAREWTFEKLDSASADNAPDLCSPELLDNIGCIEVIVLRCAGPRNAKTPSQMNLDGAGDLPDHYFGLDGQPRTPDGRSNYDDRGPFVYGSGNGYELPPPLSSYRSPYVETVRSTGSTTSRSQNRTHNVRDASPSPLAGISRHPRPHSRYSEPISPRAQPTSDIPHSSFEYGSGPLPPVGEPFHHRAPSATTRTVPGVDPEWLDTLLTKAVKKGVEESRRREEPPKPAVVYNHHTETASQPPGAWPMSLYGTGAQPSQQPDPAGHTMHKFDENLGTAWGQPQDGWSHGQAGNRRGANVTWNAEPVWESESNANGWNSHEETTDDSWDTDETWTTKKPKGWEDHSRSGRSRAPTALSHLDSRPLSPITVHIRERRRSSNGRSRKTRSKSRPRHSRSKYDTRSSSEDNEGWTHIESASDSIASWQSSDDTVQPSQSRSQLHISRSRDRLSRPSKSTHSYHGRKPSWHTHHAPAWQPTEIPSAPAPSVTTRLTPTVMNAPASTFPATGPPRKASLYTEPAASIVPPPSWGCAVPEKSRKNSYALSMPPAPYAASLHEFARSIAGENLHDSRSTSSSSWGSGKKSGAKASWGDSVEKKTGWNDVSGSDWGKNDNGKEDVTGWEVTDNSQNGVWETADQSKDAEAAGWEADNTGWDVKDGSKEQEKERHTLPVDEWDVNKDDWNTTKVADDPWGNAGDTWNNQDNIDKNVVVQGNTDALWAPATSPDQPAKAVSTSKRHTSKYVSKDRQLRSTASDLAPKSHWQFPPPSSKKTLFPIAEHHNSSKVPFIAPKEPLYKISKETASEKGVEHQVRAGKGMQYGHAIGRPEYLDRLDKPYAVFRFKYRSRAILKSMFGDKIPDHGHLTLPTPDSTTARAKDKLKDLPQDQLIEKMLKLQAKLAAKEQKHKHKHKHEERRHSDATEVVARGLTESWVKQQSRETSEKGKGEKKSVKKGDKKASGQTAGDDGEWPNVTW